MSIEFTKYKEKGAYHWEWYKNNEHYRSKVNQILKLVEEKSVLDVGAGDGLISSLLDIKGIDNDEEGVRLAREKGADVILGDAYQIPFEDESFDSVLMADVLEHLEFPEKGLLEARRVLKKYLYITTPERSDKMSKFHYQEWTHKELEELVERSGFKLVKLGFNFDAGESTIIAKFKKVTL